MMLARRLVTRSGECLPLHPAQSRHGFVHGGGMLSLVDLSIARASGNVAVLRVFSLLKHILKRLHA
jgi:hypothetical protein